MSKKKNRLIGRTFSGNKVPLITKIIYPWSGIFRDACYALVGSFLLTYAMYSGVLSSNATEYTQQLAVINTAMIIALIWDGINDPIMSLIVEKFHFKSGKYRPWILIGAIGNAIAVLCLFLIRPGNGWAFVGVMIGFYVLWDTFFTMNDIGYWSMLPSLTNDPKERASITTSVTVATSIGAFLMNILVFVLPGLLGNNTPLAYAIMAISISALFLVSQALIFFLCPEHERDVEQEEKSADTKLLDLFKIVGKNKELRSVVIAMFLYYIGSGLLTGIGVYYFHFAYGYHGQRGGLIATLLAAVYVIATVAAQLFYPLMVKKLEKKKIVTICTAVLVVSYLAFLFLVFPIFGENPVAYNVGYNDVNAGMDLGSGLALATGGSMWMIYVIAFIFFAASGVFYLALIVMLQDAIDYNEYKYGARQEAVASAWRPLTVKVSSAVQQYGIRFLIFGVTGTIGAANAISSINSEKATAEATGVKWTDAEYAEKLINAGVPVVGHPGELALFGVLVVGIILACFISAWALLRFAYKIDDKFEAEIAKVLNERHAADAAKAEQSTAA